MRTVIAREPDENSDVSHVEIPDISNRPLTLQQVLDWIDLVVEVNSNDENIRNN